MAERWSISQSICDMEGDEIVRRPQHQPRRFVDLDLIAEGGRRDVCAPALHARSVKAFARYPQPCRFEGSRSLDVLERRIEATGWSA
jgi:hypothetical protein